MYKDMKQITLEYQAVFVSLYQPFVGRIIRLSMGELDLKPERE